MKPRKVIEAMKVFSDPRFNIDVLKVEVPVNVKYVEGFADGEVVYSKAEAADFFKAQEEATNLPYIYLSAGVSAKLFKKHCNLLTTQVPSLMGCFVDVLLGQDL